MGRSISASRSSPVWAPAGRARVTPQPQSQPGLRIPNSSVSTQQNWLQPAYESINPLSHITHSSRDKETAADNFSLFFFFSMNPSKVKVIQVFALPFCSFPHVQRAACAPSAKLIKPICASVWGSSGVDGTCRCKISGFSCFGVLVLHLCLPTLRKRVSEIQHICS